MDRELLDDLNRATAAKPPVELAGATLTYPMRSCEVVFPVVAEPTLRDLVKEWKATGPPYLHGETLRREIHEGLNVTEQWNVATDFVFFAFRGELASNRREDHEVTMLALHLLQNCMIYVNTLMLQQVLAHPDWRQKLEPRDLSALTPLIWEHVNPYAPSSST